MPKKKQETFDPNNMKPEEKLKFEIASELGLADKVISGGWRSLTSKESGKIGGMVTKRKRELKTEYMAGQTIEQEIEQKVEKKIEQKMQQENEEK